MHDFEEKNFKKQILKKFCTQKITFWLNLPRKKRNFCILRAIFKKHDSEEKQIFKKHDFEGKNFS